MDPKAQLLNHLRPKHLLLILDNFEHLLEGVTLLSDMLESSPGIKLLITSRERLNLLEEWLLPLGGMGFPQGEEPTVANEEDYDAIRLFVQRARRVRRDFSLSMAGPHWVARICQLVEGMPLAIELATPWLRMMSCEEVAQEIEGGLDFVATTLRDMPERHRSMRAVFDHSWSLLSAEERSVLQKLSVFRGGFHRKAAEAVAVRPSQSPSPLMLLSSLVDKSWVRSLPSGRYELHELIRQYGAEKLEAVEEADQVRDRHSRCYGAFLQEREEHLHGRGQAEALQEILEDLDNVWAAWHWAVERGGVETIGHCVEALHYLHQMRGWYHEVAEAFEEAAIMLRQRLDAAAHNREQGARQEATLVLASVLSSLADLLYFLAQQERATALAEESLALLEQVERNPRRDRVTIHAKVMLGNVYRVRGDTMEGQQLHQEALALAEEIGDRWGRQHALHWLGINARSEARYAEAEELLLQAIAIAEEAGERFWRAGCLDNLSWILYAQGQYQRAVALAHESLQLREEIGDRHHSGFSFVRLGEIATALGNYGLAEEYFQRSLATVDESGDPAVRAEALHGQGTLALALECYEEAKGLFAGGLAIGHELALWHCVRNQIGLGYATLALGEIGEAREWLCEAMAGAMKLGRTHLAVSALMGLAAVRAEEGDADRAVEFGALVLHHPTTYQLDRDRVQDLLSQLESELSPETLATAVARGQARELEEVVAEIVEGRR